jgi:uncharacterized protein YeeX (DUF496 family)
VLDSKNYAIDFLRIEPFTDFADIKAKIEVFTKAYQLFIALQDYVMAYHHEEKTKDIVEQMRAHIRANNIDGALQVAKGE